MIHIKMARHPVTTRTLIFKGFRFLYTHNLIVFALIFGIPHCELQSNKDNNVVYVLLGNNATLLCQNEGTHENMTSWRLPNKNVITIGQDNNSSQSKYDVVTSLADFRNYSSLTITNVSIGDAGYYTCVTQSVDDDGRLIPQETTFLLRVVEPPPKPGHCREVRLVSIHPTIQCDYDVINMNHVVYELVQSTHDTEMKVAKSKTPVFDLNRKLVAHLSLDRSKLNGASAVLLRVCCVSVYTETIRSCGQEVRVSLPRNNPSSPNGEPEATSNRDIVIIAVSSSVVVFIIVVVIIFVYYNWRLKRRRCALGAKRTMTGVSAKETRMNTGSMGLLSCKGRFGKESHSSHRSNPTANIARNSTDTQPNFNHLSATTPVRHDLTTIPHDKTSNENSTTQEISTRDLAVDHNENSLTTFGIDLESNRQERKTSLTDSVVPKQGYSFYQRFVPRNTSVRGKYKKNEDQTLDVRSSRETLNRPDLKEHSHHDYVNDSCNSWIKNIQGDGDYDKKNDGYLEMSSFRDNGQIKDGVSVQRERKKHNKTKTLPEKPHSYVNLIAFDAEKVLCDKNVEQYNFGGSNPSGSPMKSTPRKSHNGEGTRLNKTSDKTMLRKDSNATKLSREVDQKLDDFNSFQYKSTPDLRIFDDNDIVEILNAGSDEKYARDSFDNNQKPLRFDNSFQGASSERIEKSATIVPSFMAINKRQDTNMSEVNLASSTFARGRSQDSIRRYFFNKRLTVISPRLDVPPKLPSKSRVGRHCNLSTLRGDNNTSLFMTSLPNLFNVDGEIDVIYDVPKVEVERQNNNKDDGEIEI